MRHGICHGREQKKNDARAKIHWPEIKFHYYLSSERAKAISFRAKIVLHAFCDCRKVNGRDANTHMWWCVLCGNVPLQFVAVESNDDAFEFVKDFQHELKTHLMSLGFSHVLSITSRLLSPSIQLVCVINACEVTHWTKNKERTEEHEQEAMTKFSSAFSQQIKY